MQVSCALFQPCIKPFLYMQCYCHDLGATVLCLLHILRILGFICFYNMYCCFCGFLVGPECITFLKLAENLCEEFIFSNKTALLCPAIYIWGLLQWSYQACVLQRSEHAWNSVEMGYRSMHAQNVLRAYFKNTMYTKRSRKLA